MDPRHNLSFCARKTAWLAPEFLVSTCPSPDLWFLHAKQRLLEQNYKSLWVPDLTCRFVNAKQRDLHQNDKSIWVPALICAFFHAKQRLMTRLTSLYGSLPSHVILCMQNSVISIRKTSLYGSQPLSVVSAFKTLTFGAELQVSVGPRPHLSFCACKTAWLASDLLVSIGLSPHLWFLYAKQRLVDQHTSLYRYQTSPVVLYMQTRDFRTRITSFCRSKTPHVVFVCKTASSGPE